MRKKLELKLIEWLWIDQLEFKLIKWIRKIKKGEKTWNEWISMKKIEIEWK